MANKTGLKLADDFTEKETKEINEGVDKTKKNIRNPF